MEIETQDQEQQSDQSTPEPTPPTPPPPAGPTEADKQARYLKFLEDNVRAQNETISALNARLSAAPPEPPAPKKSAEELRQEFYNNPVEVNRRLIKEEMEQSLAPFRDFIQSQRAATAADSMVNKFKNDPRFAGQWDDSLERFIRQQAATVDPSQLNDTTFGTLVVSAVGLKVTGMLPGGSPTPPAPPSVQPPSSTPPVVTPPHMRPSPAPSGGPPTKQNLRPLTETEERIRRENGLTHEQYLKWQEMPSADILSADFDKPRKS